MGELKMMDSRPNALKMNDGDATKAYCMDQMVWNKTVTITLICGRWRSVRNIQPGQSFTVMPFAQCIIEYQYGTGEQLLTPLNWNYGSVDMGDQIIYDGWITDGEEVSAAAARKTSIVAPDHDATFYCVCHILSTVELGKITYTAAESGYKIARVPFDDWFTPYLYIIFTYEDPEDSKATNFFADYTLYGNFHDISLVNWSEMSPMPVTPNAAYPVPVVSVATNWTAAIYASGSGYANFAIHRKRKGSGKLTVSFLSPENFYLVGEQLWPNSTRYTVTMTYHWFGNTLQGVNFGRNYFWIGSQATLAGKPSFDPNYRIGVGLNIGVVDPDFWGWVEDLSDPESGTNGTIRVKGTPGQAIHYYASWSYEQKLDDIEEINYHYLTQFTGAALLPSDGNPVKKRIIRITREEMWFNLQQAYLYIDQHPGYAQTYKMLLCRVLWPDGAYPAQNIRGDGSSSNALTIFIPAGNDSSIIYIGLMSKEALQVINTLTEWEYSAQSDLTTNLNLDKYGDSTSFYYMYYPKTIIL